MLDIRRIRGRAHARFLAVFYEFVSNNGGLCDAANSHVFASRPSAVHFHRPEVQKGLNDAVLFDRNVLYIAEGERGNLSLKKSGLIDAYQAFVGDEPEIQIVICPDSRESEPHDEEPPEIYQRPERRRQVCHFGKTCPTCK